MLWRGRRARVTIVVVVAAVLAGGLVALGRVERSSAIAQQLEGIARVRATALATKRPPDAYRLAADRDCLLYRIGPDPFALELCYSLDGRLIEAINRWPGDPKTYDLSWSLSSAPISVAPEALSRTLRRMHAFAVVHVPPGVLPSGLQDLGPHLAGEPYRPLGS